MSRFFVSRDSVKGNVISVTGEEAHHIADVMRLKVKDEVITFDGTGKEYIGVIKEVGKKSIVIEVTGTREAAKTRAPRITLIQAIPKREKIEYLIEKATELGVSAIVPIFTERTIPDWDLDKRASHVARWRKIAREASKQCGRLDIPNIPEIAQFSDVINDEKLSGLKLIAALQDDAEPIRRALKDFKGDHIYIAIGPEGDFTPDEVKDTIECGFKSVSLGLRVLKSDTAGLFALSAIDYEE
ncbi:MAG: 16S rRNA (uracil(1498)-N(3))-methyltransferase [Candidatus Omnitrophica bacterium]|nr:16S rRNA (uracil(1498)-N(3))-methyltransferase [Candidatus Omnitrophota bacterium]